MLALVVVGVPKICSDGAFGAAGVVPNIGRVGAVLFVMVVI
jgi:hypothetical protein